MAALTAPGPRRSSLRSTRTRRAILADRVATAALWGIATLVVAILAGIILHFLLAALPAALLLSPRDEVEQSEPPDRHAP